MITRSEAVDALLDELTVTSGSGATYTVPAPLNRDSDVDAAYVFDFQYAGTTQPGDMTGSSRQFSGWTSFTAPEKVRYEEMLAYVETIANVDFQLVSGQADPTMNVGKVTLPGSTAGIGGFGYSVSISGGGDVTMTDYDNFTVYDNTIALDSGRDNLILHEIMHALSAKHPFSGSNTLPAAYENNKYSVLSYTANPDNGQRTDGLALFDILALQERWGANLDTAAGDDTYSGPRNTTVDAVWDAGGIDTFDVSSRTTDVILSLVEGTFSTFDTTDDVAIAYDAVIENAVGGTGSDLITGNHVANDLSGSAGNDIIFGDHGRDTLTGGGDDDLLVGGNSNDRLYGGPGKDTLDGGVSHDKLYGGSGSDRMSGGFGNDLLFGGNARDKLDGGNGDDRLYAGNGNDTLQGRSGDDLLYGGDGKDFLVGGKGDDNLWGESGADIFHFDVTGDNDIIHDFENNVDRLELDNFAFATVNDALGFADRIGSDVVFDFGGGTTLTILNISVTGLSNDLDVV